MGSTRVPDLTATGNAIAGLCGWAGFNEDLLLFARSLVRLSLQCWREFSNSSSKAWILCAAEADEFLRSVQQIFGICNVASLICTATHFLTASRCSSSSSRVSFTSSTSLWSCCCSSAGTWNAVAKCKA